MNRYEALKHAVKAHAGAVDKCGQPYILHPIAVAEAIDKAEPPAGVNDFDWRMGGKSKEDLVVIALLHDVLEDTEYEPVTTPTEWYRLEKLTRRPREKYVDYIDRLCESWGADGRDEVPLIVKLADLAHNLSPERQDCLPDKERASLEARYLDARQRIWDALGYQWWPEQLSPEQER